MLALRTVTYCTENEETPVQSLNDGRLVEDESFESADSTDFHYPNPGWRLGVVGQGPDGKPDPARRVLTFTTDILAGDVEIAGPMNLILYASSTQRDTDFIVKISEQYPADDEGKANGLNPGYQVVSKGWLRASHRQLDVDRSTSLAPYYLHTTPTEIEPGKIYCYEIAIMPSAHVFRMGSRIRLEIANGDSSVTEYVFPHEYSPWKVGADTFFHSSSYPSRLLLPIRHSH